MCGGTIISRSHVLTAAHCFLDADDDVGGCAEEMTQYKNGTVYLDGTCVPDKDKKPCPKDAIIARAVGIKKV